MRGIVAGFIAKVRIFFLFAVLVCGGGGVTVWFFWIRPGHVSRILEKPVMTIAVPVLMALLILFFSHYLFNKGLRTARREGRLHARLLTYRSLLTVRWLLQAAAVLSALFMVVFTRNIAPFFLAAVLGIYLVLNFPSRVQAYQHLDLDSLKE